MINQRVAGHSRETRDKRPPLFDPSCGQDTLSITRAEQETSEQFTSVMALRTLSCTSSSSEK